MSHLSYIKDYPVSTGTSPKPKETPQYMKYYSTLEITQNKMQKNYK